LPPGWERTEQLGLAYVREGIPSESIVVTEGALADRQSLDAYSEGQLAALSGLAPSVRWSRGEAIATATANEVIQFSLHIPDSGGDVCQQQLYLRREQKVSVVTWTQLPVQPPAADSGWQAIMQGVIFLADPPDSPPFTGPLALEADLLDAALRGSAIVRLRSR
jgi:hypothetical protein